jgi:hypothetical protein
VIRAGDAARESLTDSGRRPTTTSGDARRLSQLDLPPDILARLELAGIDTVAEWRALGSARFQIFGIVKKAVLIIDAAIAASTNTVPRGTNTQHTTNTGARSALTK